MAQEQGSAAIPDRVTWRLRDPRADEAREYIQTELPIEGEARLLGLVMTVGTALKEGGFDFARIAALFDEGPTDWDLAMELLALASEASAQLVVDTSMILLGIYPDTLTGEPSPEYEGHRTFLMRAMNLSRFTDMLRIYAAQNDYRRALNPFIRALGGSVAQDQPSSPVTAPSDGTPPRLYGPDWMPPAGGASPEPEPGETEASTPATRTSSGRSRRS